MTQGTNRSLKVFLCHSSGDKPKVQELYSRLVSDGIDAWLDKEKLLPGQNWRIEIPKAVKDSDVVIVLLSAQSINKEGFVQKEIKLALDTADEKPAGTIFIIPARLEDCNVPERISQFQWADLFSDNGYEWLLKALRLRASTLGLSFEPSREEGDFQEVWVEHNVYENNKMGMRIHLKFSIKNHKSEKCRLVVYFEFINGTKLKDYNNLYRTIDGHVSVGMDFMPGYDSTIYDNFIVFMPYSELHLASGHHELRFCASLYDYNANAHLTYSNYYFFSID
jgi:hypothetical protein